MIEETSEDAFRIDAPLFQPMHYDDIEVPSLFKLRGRYYLIGSIREDVKVHYWWADAPRGPYRNFSDNDLLPKGNYAARISREGHRFLVWSFFYKGLTTKGRHLMAPPKELVVDDNGELHLQSFRGFNDIARESLGLRELTPLTPLLGNPDGWSERTGSGCAASCTSGFEAFLLQGEYENFMLSGELTIEDSGKHGLVFRINEDGDGYYLAVDPSKGTVQLRAWGQRPRGNPEEEFAYEEVQSADYVPTTGPLSFRLIAYEQYLEFSLNGYVLLTAADDHYARGRAGFYVGDARVRVDRPVVKRLSASEDENFPVHIVDL